MAHDELTHQRQEEFAKFVRFSTIGVVVTSVLLAIVIVGFVV